MKKRLLIFLFLALWLVTSVVTVYRALDKTNDFDTFYEAGRTMLAGESLYAVSSDEEPAPLVSPFLYPPFAACLFSVFARLPIAPSAFIWNTVSVLVFSIAIWLSVWILKPSVSDAWNRGGFSGRFDTLFLGAAAGAIVVDNLSMAQANILVFALTMGAIFCWFKGLRVIAGVALASAVWIKVTPLFFLIYFAAKRRWRIVVGFLLGSMLFAVAIPAVTMGLETSMKAHGDWARRMLGPASTEWQGWDLEGQINLLSPKGVDPVTGKLRDRAIRTRERQRKARIDYLLNQKIQSLDATLARLFLKDRREYGYNYAYPVSNARKYDGLPVLGRGIPEEWLGLFLSGILGLFLFMFAGACWIFGARRGGSPENEISFVFLTMTLLAMFVRSHHYIVWLFPFLVALGTYTSRPRHQWFLLWCVRLGIVLYFAQALPYGKAVGMGTLANVILWAGFGTVALRSSLSARS
ncbi:MAG: glycosyltransferase family 87 protein [Candidatus Omnitrophota bacterium]|nr:glycosyltransferase family 87 protein [Candidatus Omnitrophota bacterium]